MQGLYSLIAEWAKLGYLPSMFEHSFMVRGLIAAIIIGPVLGGMGMLVVTKKLSFFTQTVGHASLTGVALGLLFGEPIEGTYAGLYGFCLIVALFMTYVRNRAKVSNDTAIGVVLAQVLGIGIVLLVAVTKQFNIHQVEAILFGSLIALNDQDILLLAFTALVASVIVLRIFNRTMLVSFNPVMAKARGFDPVKLEYIFITILTAVVVSSLKLVGALLVLVLAVVPAAGAQNIAGNLRQFFWLSILFATSSTVIGLLIAGTWPIPTGGAIVLVSALLFYGSLLMKGILGRSSVNQGD